MTRYEEELQAWKDFELDCLMEEIEKPSQIIDWAEIPYSIYDYIEDMENYYD